MGKGIGGFILMLIGAVILFTPAVDKVLSKIDVTDLGGLTIKQTTCVAY